MSSGTKKYMATNCKAYKHPHYEKWHEEFRKLNLGGK